MTWYNGGMETKCEWCGKQIKQHAGPGRPRRFCWDKCRKAYSRINFPAVMIQTERWTRADGKRPIRVDGAWASTTKPWTWNTYSSVRASHAGDGFGFMLGGGIGCWDLDNMSDEQIRDFIAQIEQPIIYVERSMSGRGVHVFVEAAEGPGHRHGNIEFYSRKRFIRTTGHRFKP